MCWKERSEAYEHIEQIIKEKYEKAQKEKAEEIHHVTKETENLKQHLEKLKLDLDSKFTVYILAIIIRKMFYVYKLFNIKIHFSD